MAAVGGGVPDRQTVMAWPYGNDRSDFRCYADDTMPDRIAPSDQISLVEVVKPFGLAIQKSVDLNQILKEDPRKGNEILTELANETARQIDLAFEVGADGILYRLYGARAAHCTPMQYGGYYLERDRELLEAANRGKLNVLFVVGEDDVYLDFVTDLPAQAFGWDAKGSRITAADVRQMRDGALISEDPESDILLEPGTASLSRILETSVKTEDSYAL
jgi:hypothetical protein